MTEMAEVPQTVAEYIDAYIRISRKEEAQIARELGYEKPAVIALMRQGKLRVPVDKIRPLAAAIGVDPVYLLRLSLREYMPETWKTIEECLGPTLLTRNELALIQNLRKETGDSDPVALAYNRGIGAIVVALI